jgi:ADP-ribose pyrophosphatase YjhB (NUDIX family)
MKYCSSCGAAVHLEIPNDDNRMRHVCTGCHTIHYKNPRMVLGTIPVWDSSVLLCKRAIEPRYGYWTLPAGFMEIDESTHDGALRETLEEAGARVYLCAPFTMFDVKAAQQVHLFYRAKLLDLNFQAGPESLEVRLFKEKDIPWNNLAFKTVEKTLELYFADAKTDGFGMYTGDLNSPSAWRAEHFYTSNINMNLPPPSPAP